MLLQERRRYLHSQQLHGRKCSISKKSSSCFIKYWHIVNNLSEGGWKTKRMDVRAFHARPFIELRVKNSSCTKDPLSIQGEFPCLLGIRFNPVNGVEPFSSDVARSVVGCVEWKPLRATEVRSAPVAGPPPALPRPSLSIKIRHEFPFSRCCL